MLALIWLAQSPFFQKPQVDFWGSRKVEQRRAPHPALFSEDGRTLPPPEVLALLNEPTAENARRYLAIQEERLRRIRQAIRAIQAARPARSGCPACGKEEARHHD